MHSFGRLGHLERELEFRNLVVSPEIYGSGTPSLSQLLPFSLRDIPRPRSAIALFVPYQTAINVHRLRANGQKGEVWFCGSTILLSSLSLEHG